jgi:hypothetical protein
VSMPTGGDRVGCTDRGVLRCGSEHVRIDAVAGLWTCAVVEGDICWRRGGVVAAGRGQYVAGLFSRVGARFVRERRPGQGRGVYPLRGDVAGTRGTESSSRTDPRTSGRGAGDD